MEKQLSNLNNNNYNAPAVGAGTSTTIGVTVFDASLSNNNPPPPPPSYDQAIGNTIRTTTTISQNDTTHTPAGWNGPGAGAQNSGYSMPTTTHYNYGTSVPLPQQQQQQQVPRYHQQPTCTQPSIVIIQQQPMLPLGPEPVYLTCPSCNIQKLTRIEYEPSSRTHLMAALLCLFGLWCCVCLPYCAGSCMNTHHYCGNCGKFLGTYGNTL